MKKRWSIVIAAAVLAAAAVFPAYADWETDENGSKYRNASGSYASDQILTIDGVNYAFQGQYMVKGWYHDSSVSKWYYFDEEGAQVTGWKEIDGYWYYLSPESGAMQTSWLKLGTKKYYLDETGRLQVGTFVVDGYQYLAESDGAVITDSQIEQGDITLKFDSEGRIFYKMAETEVNAQSGGELWLPYLDDAALARQREETQENNAQYIQETMEDLVERYKDKVLSVTKTNRRANKLADWEERAKKDLSALNVSEDVISAFISDVKGGRYTNEDNDNWQEVNYNDYVMGGTGAYKIYDEEEDD